jgi:FkbM family methyltransferase
MDKGYRVYAFEPEPFNSSILRRIAHQPEFAGKIVATQCAVGAEEGTVRLWLNEHHHADHRVVTDQFHPGDSAAHGLSVPMVTVDGFLTGNPEPISFVKIDVQGFELPVCQGMKATMERNPDMAIVLEYAPSIMRELGFQPEALIRFLTDRGFECFAIGPRGKLTPGIPAIEGTGYVDLLFRRGPAGRA